jgi:hypothetical protein
MPWGNPVVQMVESRYFAARAALVRLKATDFVRSSCSVAFLHALLIISLGVQQHVQACIPGNGALVC